ncbi:MAG: hypothetical protein NW201_10545 [Gemmatimonadales bacterium]|nr:hypothetical protein [Gemmatimonadales bacterium]
MPLSRAGWAEVPCVECGRRVAGLAWTERCPDCRRAREARARRLAGRAALAATALTALVLLLSPPSDPLGRWYVGVAIIAMYLLSRRIVFRAALEFLPPAGLLLALAAAPLTAQAPTSLTLYDDGRAFVRRALPVALPAGDSEHRLALGPLELESLELPDSGVTLLEARYDAATDEAALLRRAVGKAFAWERDAPGGRQAGTATLLAVDPERWQFPDGTVSFARPGTLRVPAELVARDATLQLRVRSAARRPALRLGWFTQAGGWSAAYTVQLGARARVSGSAVLRTGPLALDDAELQLLAGSTGAPRPKQPMPMLARAAMAEAQGMDQAASMQAVGDVKLYTLPGRWTLQSGIEQLVPLFEASETTWEKGYVVPGALPWMGYVSQAGDEQRVPVEVTYLLRRPLGAPFGDRPLPAGGVQLLQPDREGRLQLVGSAAIPHTAAGQDLKLVTGTAFDLTVRRTQTSYQARRDSTKAGLRTVVTAGFLVRLENAADSAATVDVREERGGEWSVVQSSVPAEKLSSSVTRFRVRVPARGEARLTYAIRALW